MVNSFSRFYQYNQLWFIFMFAFVLTQLPVVSIPFKWLESYFHEISHGIAALASGGKIVKIQLFPNGAGLCTTLGGSAFLISFMGYAGAALWGVVYYQLAELPRKLSIFFTGVIALLLVVSMVFWVRDLLTLLIVAVLLLLVLMKLKFSNKPWFKFGMKLTGALVLLNSLKSPWYLIDGRELGDGAALSALTYIPEIVWVFCWFAIGISGIVVLYKMQKHRVNQNEK